MSISEGLLHSRVLILRTFLLAGAALTGIVWINLQADTGVDQIDTHIVNFESGSSHCVEFDIQPVSDGEPERNPVPEIYNTTTGEWNPIGEYTIERHNDTGYVCIDGEDLPDNLLIRVRTISDEVFPTIFPGSPTRCPKSLTSCPKLATRCPAEATHCTAAAATICGAEALTICPETPTICAVRKTVCPAFFTECPLQLTTCPSYPTFCPQDGLTTCPARPTVCVEKRTECPAEWTQCPKNTTRCPVELTVCPNERRTQCPKIATQCPQFDETECPVVSTRCPGDATHCSTVITTCPEIDTTCPNVPTDCPSEHTACPRRRTQCPAVSGTVTCPRPTIFPERPTVCVLIPANSVTTCPNDRTVCPLEETTCAGAATQCTADLTQCSNAPTQCGSVQPTTCLGAGGATVCPSEVTVCPREATACPRLLTQCVAASGGAHPTFCPEVQTVCPKEATKCPGLSTLCPSGPTFCPLTNQALTECPVERTVCPAHATRCVVVATECPSVFGGATECPKLETWCPRSTTFCPRQITSCPKTDTECSSVPTHCPREPTKCPEFTTHCPQNQETICPRQVTVCSDNPVPTECSGSDNITTCPNDLTHCFTGGGESTTRCPVVPTECPRRRTVCPSLATECPQAKTLCPAVPTECSPDAGVQQTVCPDEPTKCPVVDTMCPKVDTICPRQWTRCPNYPTECTQEQTRCPVLPTTCPSDEATFCPQLPTQCPKQRTLCPDIATHCPKVPTQCPVEVTNCARELTTCSGAQLHTQCVTEPTECSAGRGDTTTCPWIPTLCPHPSGDLSTECPVRETVCPQTETECPVASTQCPVNETHCPSGVTLCSSSFSPTDCPQATTICSGSDTICPERITLCPARKTECPVSETTCPRIPTVCPISEPVTECPHQRTVCPERDTLCVGSTTLHATRCPIEHTRCPFEPTVCIVPGTSPTQCPDPSQGTFCPYDHTRCPTRPTVCPTGGNEITVCPSVPTVCVGSANKVSTECPVEETRCPQESTLCPAGQFTVCPKEPTLCVGGVTMCPQEPTNCPQTPTRCPQRATTCPAETTICVNTEDVTVCPDSSGAATICPYVQTECPDPNGGLWTYCPIKTTECPQQDTLCPVKPTECPVEETFCPANEETFCPTTADHTRCPLEATRCPKTSTSCPEIRTECPETYTECPPAATICVAHARTICPEVDTQCPRNPTVCPQGRDTVCPGPNDVTRCPHEKTKCPQGTTVCPEEATICPVIPGTSCTITNQMYSHAAIMGLTGDADDHVPIVNCYTFRLKAVEWDYGGDIGTQWSLVYHQYVDADGFVLTPGDPLGSWVPFVPGPTIRGQVGDIICVTIQNRIEDSAGHFVEALEDTVIVHWHGIEIANAYDGTPVAQTPIPSGTDFTYRFKLVRPGVFWYHPHWDSMIQNPLGANGAIVCEDEITDSLRANKVVPHEDRTFVVTLAAISFQNDRLSATSSNYVPVAAVAATDPVYIRNVMPLGGSVVGQSFGDAILINGKHIMPFNDPSGNTQQFWEEGLRTNSPPVELASGESVAVYLTNNGMHRFYKVHLAYKTALNNAWVRSDGLFRIGGEGGMLDEARLATGTFGDWRIRGIKNRANGEGLGVIQNASELEDGEVLLATATRNMVAFHVEPGWTEVSLRASGFSVQNSGATADENPTDLVVATFAVGGTANADYVLTTNISQGTPLRTNSVLGALADPLEDLRGVVALTSFPHTKADLDPGVMVTTNATIMQDYNITLTQSGGPAINGIKVHWDDTGPFQDTYENTRYVSEGDVVEWTVETMTPSADHPWHSHGFSFQPVKMELKTSAGYVDLYEWDHVEYMDTIYVPANHRVTYRFRVEDRDFIDSNYQLYPGGVFGRWLAHCHIFKHAHKGMMMEFIVVDGDESLIQRRFLTDIYIRDNTADDGIVPSSGTISMSPDLILRPSIAGTPTDLFGEGSGTEGSSSLGYEVEYGQDNYVYVRCKNRGYEDTVDVTTDVYWSEVSTLVTPDHWSYLGTTNPEDVPAGDTLVVADPITWAQADIPAEGHYCLVGVSGNFFDPKTLTQTEVANFDAIGMTWEEFQDLIRGHNNVTWRNFNVVDVDLSMATSSFGPYKFKFRGAFDKDRQFDLLVIHPFGDKLLWKIPTASEFWPELKEQLERKALGWEIKQDNLVTVRCPPNLLIEGLTFLKKASYESEFILEIDNPYDVLDKEFRVSQLYKFPEGPVEVGRVVWKHLYRTDDFSSNGGNYQNP